MTFSNDEAFSDVEDITEVLEVTVFDENRRTKHDFLGKVNLAVVDSDTYYFHLNPPDSSPSTKDPTRREEMVQTEGEEYQEGCSRSSS